MAQWSIAFSGKSDFATCGDLPTGGLSALTVEAWIYINGSVEDTAAFVVKEGEWELCVDADNQLTFAVTTGGTKTASDGTIISSNTWYHVAGWFAGQKVGMYLDGALVGSANTTAATTLANTANQVEMGRIADGGGYWYLSGSLAYVRISNNLRYDQAFSIPRLPHTPDANTLAQWDFIEGSGDIVKDRCSAETTYDAYQQGGQYIWSLDVPTGKWGSAYDSWGDEWIIYVNGVDRTANIELLSLSITDEVSGKSQASFTIVDTTPITVAAGTSVTIWHGGTIEFSGAILEHSLVPRGVRYDIECSCVDWSYLLDAAIVEGEMTWSGVTAREIVLACFNPFGWSVRFDGTSDGLVDCGTHGTSGFSGSWTLECWFRVDTLPSISDVGVLVGRWEVTSNYNFQWYIVIRGDGKLGFGILWNKGGGLYEFDGPVSTTVCATGTWYHVAGVWNGSKAQIYVDGTKENEYTPGGGWVPFNESAHVWLGGRYDGDANHRYTGAMNWTRISKNARYSANFTPLDGCPASDSNTVTLYDMQEGWGTKLDNLQGTATRDGTLDTGVTWTPAAHYGTESFCSVIEATSSASGGHVYQGATGLYWGWNWQYISDVLDDLARISNYVWYVRQMEYGDNPLVLFFTPQNQTTAPIELDTLVDLTASPPRAPFKITKWTISGTSIRNYVILKNDTQIVRREDVPSQNAYGILKMFNKADNGLTTSFIEDIGDGLLAQYGSESTKGSVMFWTGGTRVGHMVRVVHSTLDLNDYYLITRLGKRPRGGGMVEYAADVQGVFLGRQKTLEEVLKSVVRETTR